MQKKEKEYDLFGEEIINDPLLRDKFIEPPFSILDTKSGSWQSRKKLWQKLGIKSEVGRDGNLIYNKQMSRIDNYRVKEGKKADTLTQGSSIFDPALCEVLYHWFCEPGGKILDPFAGGSVRGIVAHYLGYKYAGIDIRPEQIKSNYEQAEEILDKHNQPYWMTGDSNVVLRKLLVDRHVKETDVPYSKSVKISVKSLQQLFQPCEPEYIKNVCHGRCCEGGKGQILVTIHESEQKRIKELGGEVQDGFLVDSEGCGLCPFKKEHLCSIHEDKPFGCKASPFTLNKNDTLIIRNRYRLLTCYKTPDAIPAYKAHRWSLEQIFGVKEVERIINEIEKGAEEVHAVMPSENYKMLKDNDDAKHSRFEVDNVDFVFSCPPYADLEVYSDLKGDISNMDYNKFLEAYRSIIDQSCKLLKAGGFACFVVGEIRDKKGNYRGFVPDTIKAFQDAGMHYYNEAILLNPVASASMRASGNMKTNKLVKIHQNVLIFRKGN
jgi:DNA modification methylase